MKQFTMILAAVLMNAVAFAYQKQNTKPFTEISFAISGTAFVTKGSTHSVEIKGDKNDLEDIKVEVEDGRLIIKSKDGQGWFTTNSHSDVKVYITTSDISYIAVSGSGELIGQSKFDTDDLNISVSGSGHVQFQADAKDVDMRISGSGSIELSGTGDKGDLSISGSGKLDAEEFVANAYEISISGSGSCKINVKEEIESSISGSGSIMYKGNPSKINNKSSGSGKIRKI